jgi:secondary thiamine-phosphate synthase enzyme
METVEIVIRTWEEGTVDLTSEVVAFCSGRGDGLCHIFVPHATAGLALVETGAGSEHDLLEAVERLLPHDDRYKHQHGAYGHGADHLVPAFLAPSLVLAVHHGEPLLGTWQSVVLVDTNADHKDRRVALSFLEERTD